MDEAEMVVTHVVVVTVLSLLVEALSVFSSPLTTPSSLWEQLALCFNLYLRLLREVFCGAVFLLLLGSHLVVRLHTSLFKLVHEAPLFTNICS